MLSIPEMTAIFRFNGSTCPTGFTRPPFRQYRFRFPYGYSSLHRIAALSLVIAYQWQEQLVHDGDDVRLPLAGLGQNRDDVAAQCPGVRPVDGNGCGRCRTACTRIKRRHAHTSSNRAISRPIGCTVEMRQTLKQTIGIDCSNVMVKRKAKFWSQVVNKKPPMIPRLRTEQARSPCESTARTSIMGSTYAPSAICCCEGNLPSHERMIPGGGLSLE